MKLNEITNLDAIALIENSSELFKLRKYKTKEFTKAFIGLGLHRSGFYGTINPNTLDVKDLDEDRTIFDSDNDVYLLIEGVVVLKKVPVNNGAGTIVYRGYGVLEVDGTAVHDGRADGGIADAPSNGTQYARQDGAWEPIAASGGGAVYERTIYVSSNGDDVTGARNDTSKPFATIGAAHTAAINGDSIIVYPGTYTVGSNQITKSVQIFAPYGEVIINSFSSTNCINDSGGAIDFKMIGNIRWISIREPLQAGTQTGIPIWSFTNASSEVYIDVEYCQAFRMRVHRLTGSFFKINSSLRFYIEPANLTNTQFKLGDSHNFGWVDDVFNIGNMQGVVVGPVGGRAKLTKDNSFNQGATFNRHKSVIYQGNGGGSTPAATFSSDVTFVNFDVDSPRNTIQCNPHMNYTFENCLFETDRSSGNGIIFISLGGSIAPFNKKLTLNNCRWRSLVGGAIGYRPQFNATSGAAEARFLGTNIFQVTGASAIQGIVAAATYDLSGALLSNSSIASATNNIVGTAPIIDSNITVK